MARQLWMLILTAGILIAGCAAAQAGVPGTSLARSPATSPGASPGISDGAGRQQTTAVATGLSSTEGGNGKVGLMRGVVKRVDPIHDELLIHAFGGGDVRIAFDPRTQLLPENTGMRSTSIPVGSVVSVDTVIDDGKLFARSVRVASSNSSAVQLIGQVVRYDAAQSQLTLRDPITPESISLRINPSTTVVNRGRSASPQALSPGMLVRVWFSPTQRAANNVEVLAEPGNSYAFEGRVIALDLRSHILALSNDTDQSVRELAVGSLDATSLSLLREGADVSIQAEFDGDRYNVRTVSVVPRNP